MPVGGKATRALDVTADVIPKHLIRLGNGLPILEVALRQLQEVGFRRFVFCTGHHQEQISDFVRKETWRSYDSWYELSVETQPLGPEGAILAAISELGIAGQAMFVAGDVMVPWIGLAAMNERHAVSANSSENLVILEQLSVKGKKYRNTLHHKIAYPTSDFYKLYSRKHILDIISNLSIHREIPRQYNYFDQGAINWEKHSEQMWSAKTPNILKSTVDLINANLSTIDTLLEGRSRVNIIDIGDYYR